ncbi:MAG TPA: NAD(P)/FAD-dependent oxidoreductase [Limnobacter sp.]|uniref:NAD(P)/FAD-dependent oxidoreductase n=1 Tax=Limnobacter sp. TaxID=2003368 RepID=UPI002ED7E2C1
MQTFDVLVLGAGAAGLMCAAQVGQGSRARGWRVGLLDHSEKLAEKIRISGGGRCNFTNRVVTERNFVSANPRFARAALAAYTPDDFVALVKSHRIPFHEKHKGQLFCDRSSEDIIDMLAGECRDGGVHWLKPHAVQQVLYSDGVFRLDSTAGPLTARHLVIATGGLPVPKIGATDFGLRVAKQFGHALVDQRPALVPLTFDAAQWGGLTELAGVALPVRSRGSETQAPWFDEDLLFTHRGLSGPAILQASSYWNPGEPLALNLSGGEYTAETFTTHLLAQAQGSRAQADNWLAAQLPHWPRRLLQHWLALPDVAPWAQRKVAELGKKQLGPLAASVAAWAVRPNGTEGYKKAEVMRGGVSTADLQSKTLESRRIPGLYFIGEVVDVTGWLGGYNFQWAWASGVAAARGILSKNA